MSTTSGVLASGPFDSVLGLPVHPLVVHAAVVLLPLAAAGLILIIAVPRLRAPLGWLVMAGLAAAAGSAFVAAESGEQLADRVGEPELHAELGEVLPWLALGLFGLGLAWFLVVRRQGPRALAAGLAVGAVLAAAVNIGWVVRVGHTGAEAVWSSVPAAEEDHD